MLQRNSINERVLVSDNPFQTFIDLVNYDQETRALHSEIKTLSDEDKLLHQQKEELLLSLEQFKESIKELRKGVELQELDIKSYDEQEKHKRKQLDEVGGEYKEYQALKREIDRLKHMQHETEEELISLWNKLEVGQKELDEKQKKTNEEIEQLDNSIKEKQEKMSLAEAKLKDRSKNREAKLQNVPEEWLEKYNHMSMQVSDPVVSVLNGSCSACFYAITQPELIRLKRRAIVQCKGCFRLLYMKEAMDEEQV